MEWTPFDSRQQKSKDRKKRMCPIGKEAVKAGLSGIITKVIGFLEVIGCSPDGQEVRLMGRKCEDSIRILGKRRLFW